MTQAIRIHEFGGADRMTFESIDLDAPGPGCVRIRTQAIGVNFIDTYHRTGAYPVSLPFTLGVEAAGTVEALGPDVRDFAEGDRVAWTLLPGSYAEACNVPTAILLPIPDGLETELAAATTLQGMTAHYLAHGCRETKPGDTALVHAAAGGTGGLLVQILARAGARVLATCGTKEKAERARAAGADEVILYTEEDFAERTRALTNGRGVDVVYDSVGRTTFEGSLASLRPRGLLCLFGQASGPVPPFELSRLNDAGSLFVTRPSLAHYVSDPDERRLRSRAVFDDLLAGRLVQPIGGRYPLSEAARAHRDLEGRGTTGKLLLVPGDSQDAGGPVAASAGR